jgi:Flp pilus assembly pilin Flp
MNFFKKTYGLILGIITCLIILRVDDSKLFFGKLINRFYSCADCLGCSFPCYGIYDTYLAVLAVAVAIVLVGILIFKLIKFFRR